MTLDAQQAEPVIDRRVLLFRALLLALVSLPQIAFADMILPIAVLAVPGMLILFIPITLLEGYVLKARLAVAYRRALWVSAVANLASTLVGLPFANVALAGFSPRHAFVGDSSVFTSLSIMLVPFFLGSLLVEYFVVRWMLRNADRRAILIAVLIGNALSYLLVAGSLLALKLSIH